MGSVHVTAHRLWKAVAFAAAFWFVQSSPAAADDRLLADLNGDGRTDLLVMNGAMSGYFPLRFSGGWDRESFRRYRHAPSFGKAADVTT